MKKFWYKTSFMVFAYAASLGLAVLIQAAIALLIKYNVVVHAVVFANFLNGNIEMPISNMAWTWCAICAAYIGVDRASYTIKSANLMSGSTDIGDPKTLREIILASGSLFVIAVTCNGLVDADFDLNAFASAFGSSVLLYVAGQKAIKSVKYVNGKIDANGNGIPDEEENLEMCDGKAHTEQVADGIIAACNYEKTEEEKASERVMNTIMNDPESKESQEVAKNIIKAAFKKDN